MSGTPTTSDSPGWRRAGIAACVVSVLLLFVAGGAAFARQDTGLPVAEKPPLAGVQPVAITVVGDSYTGGSAEGGVGAAGWPALVWTELRTAGIDVSPKVSGHGGTGYVARGVSGLNFRDAATRLIKPTDDIVVFFGSLNDAPVPIAEFDAEAGATLTMARQFAPKAAFIVVGPVWPGPNPSAEIPAVRDALARWAVEVNATFVDPVADGWLATDPQLIGQDKVHPNDAGHAFLAARLGPIIRSAVDRRILGEDESHAGS